MSRLTDVVHTSAATGFTEAGLPVVDWASFGGRAPVRVDVDYAGPTAPLPKADVALITWTSAEWSALDHVFLRSSTTEVMSSTSLEHDWCLYDASAPSVSPAPPAPLWGYYALVDVGPASGASKRVLLFKSDSHLAHPPWMPGLIQVVTQIVKDSAPGLVCSAGTAGGSRLDLRLGDVVLTNSGHVLLRDKENASPPISGQTFTSTGAFPKSQLLDDVQSAFFEMSSIVTTDALQEMLDGLHAKNPSSQPFTLDDLVNAALDPANLGKAQADSMAGTPLLTTDYYYIAEGTDDAQWAFLEMDDAVVGYAAAQAGADYLFVRNVSDPLVPTATSSGTEIPASVRGDWSGDVYTKYGGHTSFNSSLAAWAAIAGG